MATDLEQLIEFGFDPEKAKLALKQTGGLQPALDWLEKNADVPLEDLQARGSSSSSAAAQPTGDAGDEEGAPALKPGEEARSLVCNECGKKFRSTAQAEFHASKTEHQDFAESTEEIAPLTEAEKKQKLEELREKLAAKRANQSLQDKEDHKKNESIRRKATSESQDIREDLAKKEQIKEAQKKRQEKQADIDARKRVLAKLEADKAERKRKADLEKAARSGAAPPPTTTTTSTPIAAAPPKPSTHAEARLRLQTPSGNLLKSFPASTTLFEVAHAVQQEQPGTSVTAFEQNFPRKVFDQTDFGLTLREAGWVPSAALVVR